MFEQIAKCLNCTNGLALYVLNQGDKLSECKCGYCGYVGMMATDPEFGKTLPRLAKNGSVYDPNYVLTRYTF